MSSAPYEAAFVEALLASYAALLREPLVPPHVPPADAAAWLYAEAGFAVLAHDTQPDPSFVYANLEAQRNSPASRSGHTRKIHQTGICNCTSERRNPHQPRQQQVLKPG